MKYTALLLFLLPGCITDPSAVDDDGPPDTGWVDGGFDVEVDGAPVIRPPHPEPPPPEPQPRCDQPDPGSCEALGCHWGATGCVDLDSRACWTLEPLDCAAHDRCNFDGEACVPAVDDCDLRHPMDCEADGACYQEGGRCAPLPEGPCETLRQAACGAAWDCRPARIEGCPAMCAASSGQGFYPEEQKQADVGASASPDAGPDEPPGCETADECWAGAACHAGECRDCCPEPWIGCEDDPAADADDRAARRP